MNPNDKQPFLFALVHKTIMLFVPNSPEMKPGYSRYELPPGYYELEDTVEPYDPTVTGWRKVKGTEAGRSHLVWNAMNDDPESGVTLYFRRTKYIYALVKNENLVLNSSRMANEPMTITPGYYELEVVPNPHGTKENWYVLKGTTYGMVASHWSPLRRSTFVPVTLIYLREPLKKQRHQFPQPDAQATA
ncbi:MAG: hypothetical protein UT02_C0019G0002 [Parcubacteria group bacterium GW2011_GWC2_38_7]|nr:MAG: hypothetical protein UT02_C0019G0002 [Parcubacteria group bacterium GW2011_GWC2_38_7]